MIAFRRHLFESCKLEVGLALIPMIIFRQLHHPCMSGGLGFVLQALAAPAPTACRGRPCTKSLSL